LEEDQEPPESLLLSHSQGWPEGRSRTTNTRNHLQLGGTLHPIIPSGSLEELLITLANPYTDMEDTTSNVISWIQQLCTQETNSAMISEEQGEINKHTGSVTINQPLCPNYPPLR